MAHLAGCLNCRLAEQVLRGKQQVIRRLLKSRGCPLQVPWHALRSAPVVIELSDVHLCLGLLDESDLAAGPAAERAWAAKQAELAVAELEAAAAASGGVPGMAGPGGSNPAASGDGGKAEGSKGMLWSFLQHMVTMLVNKLQLRVRNVHISLQVGSGGVATSGPYFLAETTEHPWYCCRTGGWRRLGSGIWVLAGVKRRAREC